MIINNKLMEQLEADTVVHYYICNFWMERVDIRIIMIGLKSMMLRKCQHQRLIISIAITTNHEGW